jgi:hypothetical protein
MHQMSRAGKENMLCSSNSAFPCVVTAFICRETLTEHCCKVKSDEEAACFPENSFGGFTAYIQEETDRLVISKLDLRCLVVAADTSCFAAMPLPDLGPVSAMAGALEAQGQGAMGNHLQVASPHSSGLGQERPAGPLEAEGLDIKGCPGSQLPTLGGNTSGLPVLGVIPGSDIVSVDGTGDTSGKVWLWVLWRRG